MLAYLAVLFCFIAAAVGGHAAPDRRVNVPLRYVTVEDFVLQSETQHTFKAEIGCDSAKNATASVCAELPNNWDWQDFKGFVYMNVFNSNVTTNLSAALGSTGLPASGKLAIQCVNITNWPGGDMYIRVDANPFTYVVYTISVKLFLPPANQQPLHNYEPRQRTGPLSESNADPNGLLTTLTRVITVDDLIDLEYNKGVMLEVDLCLPPQKGSNLRLGTTVLAETGIYTHFICKDENCSPDSPTVIGSEVAPLPSGYAQAGINNLSKVYVSVYNLGGVRDNTTNKVMGHFRFGGNLYQGSQ